MPPFHLAIPPLLCCTFILFYHHPDYCASSKTPSPRLHTPATRNAKFNLPFSTQRNISAYVRQFEFQFRYTPTQIQCDFPPSFQHLHGVMIPRRCRITCPEVAVTVVCVNLRTIYSVHVKILELKNYIISTLVDGKFRSLLDMSFNLVYQCHFLSFQLHWNTNITHILMQNALHSNRTISIINIFMPSLKR